jgi:hypothetical protein
MTLAVLLAADRGRESRSPWGSCLRFGLIRVNLFLISQAAGRQPWLPNRFRFGRTAMNAPALFLIRKAEGDRPPWRSFSTRRPRRADTVDRGRLGVRVGHSEAPHGNGFALSKTFDHYL